MTAQAGPDHRLSQRFEKQTPEKVTHDHQLSTSCHYSDVIMSALASQITSLTVVFSTLTSGADQRKHQSSTWLAFVQGIRRWPVNSLHKWPVTRKMFSFDDVIIFTEGYVILKKTFYNLWKAGYLSSCVAFNFGVYFGTM